MTTSDVIKSPRGDVYPAFSYHRSPVIGLSNDKGTGYYVFQVINE